MSTYSVSASDVAAIVRNLDYLRSETIAALGDYRAMIESEIDAINELRMTDNQFVALSALSFAMASPQCKFDVNVRITKRLVDNVNESFDSLNDVYQMVTANETDKCFTSGNIARAFVKSQSAMRSLDTIEKDSLLTLKKMGSLANIGQKTASMAAALYDAKNPVFTLDVHMLRGLLRGIGVNLTSGVTISDKLYVTLETILVATLADWFADVDVFVCQWALWNRWGFGTHVSHLGIFGLGN